MKRSYLRISTLLWADILVAYALFVMQNYLTDVWKLSFTHAAGILNVWNGISMLLPFLFLFLVDMVLGNFGMLVFSSIAYSFGIGSVAMSTPAVFAKFTGGSCKQDKPVCIGPVQMGLFYTGMVLIAVGKAGNSVSVDPFLKEQGEQDQPLWDGNCSIIVDVYIKLPTLMLVVLIPLVGAIALPYIKPWSLQFGIPAICTAIAMFFFLSGFCYKQYYAEVLKGRPASNICRVSVIPMWLTFVICGIVSSIGNTYFVEQANHLDQHIWKVNIPLQAILFLFEKSKQLLGELAAWVIKYLKARGPLFGIGVAIVFSILCCGAAAKTEQWRLHAVRKHNLVDKPDEDIPMSVYWLLIQFSFLAGLESFFEKSVEAFYEDQASGTMKHYMEYLTKGVFGLGHMFSVLSVYVVGKISERGGQPNWFQFTLNKSRLDRYYWVLAALSGVNLIVFFGVASCYRCRSSGAGDGQLPEVQKNIQEQGDPEERQCLLSMN